MIDYAYTHKRDINRPFIGVLSAIFIGVEQRISAVVLKTAEGRNEEGRWNKKKKKKEEGRWKIHSSQQ